MIVQPIVVRDSIGQTSRAGDLGISDTLGICDGLCHTGGSISGKARPEALAGAR